MTDQPGDTLIPEDGTLITIVYSEISWHCRDEPISGKAKVVLGKWCAVANLYPKNDQRDTATAEEIKVWDWDVHDAIVGCVAQWRKRRVYWDRVNAEEREKQA